MSVPLTHPDAADRVTQRPIDVVTIETPSLGDRSYLLTDGDVAIVVDPQRDVDRVLALVDERQLHLTHVVETHMHNDYVSGGLDLARRTGATYVVSAAEDVGFEHLGVADGDLIETGALRLRVVATPGHTPHHVSFVLEDVTGRTLHAFTGGSLLFGAVGRPDLISPEMTPILVREQYRSVRRLANELADETRVHPTHGFGSHCASGSMDDTLREGTIADERTRNRALTVDDEDRYVEELLAGLHPWPAYYVHMGPINLAGADPLDLTPPRSFDADALREALRDGAWLVDLRDRRAYARDHVRGTINVELRNDLPTYLGWVIPWDVPMVLLGATADDVAEAQRMLGRIGLDHPAGMATGGPADWADEEERTDWPTIDFATLQARIDDPGTVVVDVRDAWEWDESHHPQALHIPFFEVPDRAAEIPDGTVHVYCATGNRATLAVSLLARLGRDVVLVDDFCLPGDTPWD